MSVMLMINGKRSDGGLSGSVKADAPCAMVLALLVRAVSVHSRRAVSPN